MLEALFSRLDAQRAAVIRWQRAMTARPALSPENGGDGEEEKAAWIEAEITDLGFCSIRRHNSPDSRVSCGFRPNLSARIPGYSPQTLWVVAHMDVVPPGAMSLWAGPPWELRVEGDLVYGRGVEDNQQAMASVFLAADALVQCGITPDISLGLLCICDEESGMAHGLPHVLETAPDLFRPDDMFLVPDMGSWHGDMIEVAEKSCLWFSITVHAGTHCTHAPGRQAPAEPGAPQHAATSALVLALERLYRVFRKKDALFVPSWSTFVPAKKEAPGFLPKPGQDSFCLDCRVLPEYDLDEVEREIRSIVADITLRYAVRIDIDRVHRECAPPPTPVTAPVVRRLVRALETHRALQPRVCGLGGQTIASCLRRKHMETAVWATLLPNPHAANECSRISATVDDAKIILAMLFTGQED